MKRRDFLSVGGVGVMSAMAAGLFGRRGFSEETADRRLRVGLIGSGWYGKVDLLRLIQVAPVEVTALCDVHRPRLEEAGKIVAERQLSHNTPALFGDYRTMLDREPFDLILVGTPDHWHALPAIAAMEKGADVWIQKPIGVDVAECRALSAAAKKNRRVTQVGLQRRSTPHLIEMKRQMIDSGELGEIAQVDIFSYYGGGDLFQEACSPPDGFDYEMWTGPAPMRPFHPVVADRGWRQFMEYGNGTVGDMGVHMFDMTRWLLGLGWPKRISSTGGRYVYKKGIQNISDTQTVIFDYETMQVVWNHRHWGGVPDPRHPWGGCFHGTKGLLKASVFGWDFIPKGKSEPSRSGEVVYELDAYPEDETEPNLEKHCAPGVRNQMRDLVIHLGDRGPTVCPMEEGAISTISCILGNIAMTLGRVLEWDAEAGCVKNDDEANRLLVRDYRAPWIHPAVSFTK